MNKACPLLLRKGKTGLELLSFVHPLAGKQLVKGTIERNETLERACERELLEESGLVGKATKRLGIWNSGYEDQVWGFCTMQVRDVLKEQWAYHSADDGGHQFSFFWQSLSEPLGDEWHALFKGAFEFVRKKL